MRVGTHMRRRGRKNVLAAICGCVDSSTIVIFEVFRNDDDADKWPSRFEKSSLSVLLDLQAAGKRSRLRRRLMVAN